MNPQFGKLRSFFWPIENRELKKFLPMAFMMFFIIFVYTLLRGTKDGLVVTSAGAGIISFLKGYVVFPSSILFVLVYGRLVDLLKKDTVFYTVCIFFLSFFALFAFVIFPNKDMFHPAKETVDQWVANYPAFRYFFYIIGTWSYSAFYVMSELWGSTMNSLLFWQFANEITRTNEAKRFYGMFILLANFSGILSGFSMKWFSNGVTPETSVMLTCSSVVLSGLIIMWTYRWINRNVLTDPVFYNPAEQGNKPKKKKEKMTAGESMKLLFTSKYLLMIALLVLSYGISVNLIELLWKNQMKMQFPNLNDYNAFMGNVFIGTGIATILVVLVSKNIIMRFGWFMGAILTPLMMLVTGMIFFACVFFSGLMDPLTSLVGMSSLLTSVWLGTIQNVLSKSVKYGLFDPTKEMAYIPLEDNLKVKGKAAVDVIGARLGKASGGYIASGLLIATAGTVSDIAPILTIFIIGIIVVWIYAVVTLSKLYHAKLAENAAAAAE